MTPEGREVPRYLAIDWSLLALHTVLPDGEGDGSSAVREV